MKAFTSLKINNIIPIFGNKYKIAHSGQLRGITRVMENKIIVNGLEEHTSRKIEEFLINLLYAEINYLAIYYARKLQVKYNKITIRKIRSRWGSCSSKGNLSFNLHLIFCPYHVVEYVVIHEICHLLEMNHSRKFWNMVKLHYSDYIMAKSYLKKNGRKAFYYKFLS